MSAFNVFQKKKPMSAGDNRGNLITNARRGLTITKTMTGGVTKDKILVPKGAYEVEILHASGGTFRYYEGKAHDAAGDYATYTEDGQTFGTGKIVGQTYEPCYDDEYFWVLGTGDLYITFYSIMEE